MDLQEGRKKELRKSINGNGEKNMAIYSFKNKSIVVNQYTSSAGAECIIYFHASKETADKIALELKKFPITLIAISGEDWNADLTPWQAETVFKSGEDFAGRAEEYLDFLCKTVIPDIERKLYIMPARRIVLGYSLAGLFAVYALFKTELFSDAISVSGSMWYDGFESFVLGNEPLRVPEKIYFSLGEKENHTRNERMSKVLDSTKNICKRFEQFGADTIFEINQGNHFYEEEKRIVKAIEAIL